MELQSAEKLYNLEKLKKMVGENEEFLTSLAGIYLATAPASSKEMMLASETNDWMTVSKLAHKMKPTIDSLSIDSIKTDIRTLETDAKNKVNIDMLGKIAIKVDQVINIVAQQLRYEYGL